ncbi:hypothetical protein GH723_14760 [Actinomarinicola tropica]|uniref:D-alanyl-D-alanine carboxypeptidase-like core domain-containing protein n=1 Tax=Actinomarinicola tropica TaxID=2789776 RepID=A0A5Q2RRN6_9ACTN|nr:hypothetical protein GH723_14760 [Actinomarinicola tropica]
MTGERVVPSLATRWPHPIGETHTQVVPPHWRATEKGLYSQGGLAATPGTSNHGWGLSVDLDLNPASEAWMKANAPRFGFVEDVPREPWHWTYRPAQ